MSKINEENLLVSLDIGTSKVVAVVAVRLPDQNIEILGIGSHASRGLKKGVVVNIDATVQAIRLAIEEAESMSECEIKKLVKIRRDRQRKTHSSFQLECRQKNLPSNSINMLSIRNSSILITSSSV